MSIAYSSKLRDDVMNCVQEAAAGNGIVNVYRVAEQARRRNLAENVALEDIEAIVLRVAQQFSAVIEFDRAPTGDEQSVLTVDIIPLAANASGMEAALFDLTQPGAIAKN